MTFTHSNSRKIAIIANNPIRNDQANGILVSSLWNCWERNSLYGIYFPVMIDYEPHWDTCHDYRSIDLFGRCKAKDANQIQFENMTSRKLTEQVKCKPRLLGWAKVFSEIWAAKISSIQSTLTKELQEIKPDCVYALIGNYWLSKVVLNSAKALDIPVYLHVTDDYVTSLYKNLPFKKSMAKASEQAFIELANYSAGRAAISPIMAKAYEDRYGLKWDWFTTLVDPLASQSPIASSNSVGSNKPITLTYAGGIRIGRHESLLKLADALEKLSESQSLKSVLNIYAPDYEIERLGKELSEHPFVRIKGWINPEELPEVLNQSDILVHAESFEEEFVKYTKLSFSTKLSQYMMTDKPILGIGPEEVGSMRMIHETGSGLVLTTLEANELSLLHEFLTDRKQQSAYGLKGKAWAKKWVSKEEGSNRFRKVINQAIDNYINAK